jgi:hypothetical protein
LVKKRDTLFQMGVKDLKTGGAASSQQVALGGFTAAEAARHPAECGYNELPENDCEHLSLLPVRTNKNNPSFVETAQQVHQ